MNCKIKLLFSIFVLCSYLSTAFVSAVSNTQPEQIHLSYGKSPNEMMVTWVTFDPTNTSTVEYGTVPKSLNKVKFGTATKFVDGGSRARVLYIHKVLLEDLVPGTEYVYHCGSIDGWSAVFWFTAMKEGTGWSPSLVVYGDLGNYNAQSLPRIQKDVQKGMYDAVLHVGDMAYDLHTDDALIGDEFMRQIETIAAYLPYQVCVGNHKQAYNFSNYVNRFIMMNQEGEINNHYYSFNLGPAHIIAFSTEFYFWLNYGWVQIAQQYNWLENDLKKANSPENRAERPWIITMGHRPMYCSTKEPPSTTDDCKKREGVIRKGLPISHAYGLEDLFYKYGVDLEFWAHEHHYERTWPLYDFKVYNGSYDTPYTNPKAPIHITTGSAGCQENLDPFMDEPAEWSAARFSDYGYTRLQIINSTHLYLEQISDDQNGAVLDTMLLIKDKHGAEAWL